MIIKKENKCKQCDKNKWDSHSGTKSWGDDEEDCLTCGDYGDHSESSICHDGSSGWGDEGGWKGGKECKKCGVHGSDVGDWQN